MKKFILKAVPFFGIAFLFAAEAKAQTTIEIRDSYTQGVITDDTIYFYVALGSTHQYDFDYFNVGSQPVTYKFTKTNVQLQPGASSWFCVYHNNDANDPQSQCYIPSVTNSGNFATDPGEFNTLLADFSAGTTNTGISIVNYKYYDISNPNDSALLTLVYNVTPVGITESFAGSLGEPYPNPASSSVTIPYQFAGENATMVITDATGRIVLSEVLSNRTSAFVLNTETWATGIYFVSLSNAERIVARRKLVVE